jgi:hypothetical protein
MDFIEPDPPSRLFRGYADSPFGGSVYDDFPVPGSRGGGRTRLSGVAEGYNVPGPVLRNRIRSGFPIDAPYEGVGVFPNGFMSDFMPQYAGGFPTTSAVPAAFGGVADVRPFRSMQRNPLMQRFDRFGFPGRPVISFDDVMRAQPMDEFNYNRNIPF